MRRRFQGFDHPLLKHARRIADYATTGWRRTLLMLFFVAFSFLVIARIIIGNWDMLVSYQWQIRPAWLFAALIFFIVDFTLAVWIWHLLVARLANYRDFHYTVKFYLQANLSRRIPGMVWYIASRAVLYQDVGVSKMKISLLSGLELAFFMISGFVTTLLMLPFWSGLDDVLDKNAQIALFIIMLLVSVALVHPRFLQQIWALTARSLPAQELHWKDTVLWLILYVLTWLFGGLVLFSVINFFQPMPVTQLMAVIGIWSLSGTISLAGAVTFSVIGLREITLTLLLTQLLPLPVTLIIAITIRLLWLTGELLTSILSFRL